MTFSLYQSELDTNSSLCGRVEHLRQYLTDLSYQISGEIECQMSGCHPGEMRSKNRANHGLEQETSEIFSPGDDARLIDVRRLPSSLAYQSLETVIARREMVRQTFRHYSDTELVIILDLSLSMLTGCRDRSQNSRSVFYGDKLWGLYLAANIFLTLGEQVGFILRIVYARDGTSENLNLVGNMDIRLTAVDRLSENLLVVFSNANKNPSSIEKFSIAGGLEEALNVRTGSVVILISDFMDPIEKYRQILLEVLDRHKVVLVDVANSWDYAFPIPMQFSKLRFSQWLQDWFLANQYWRDVVRHVEMGTEPRQLEIEDIRTWNSEIQGYRHDLRLQTNRFGANFCEQFRTNKVEEALQLGHQLLVIPN